jgi:acyl carrier protein
MNLTEFINKFASEFNDTPLDNFKPDTIYKDLDEWDSVMALTIISLVEEIFNIRITGNELRVFNTIDELYQFCNKQK